MKKNKRLRVVLDTNVLISALVFGGKPRQVTDVLAEKKIDIVIAEEILTELRRKVRAKFPIFIEELLRLELLLNRYAERVLLGSIRVSICRDEEDNRIIETAMIGHCQYIVSGDKDLLSLKSYGNIRIIKPAVLLEMYGE